MNINIDNILKCTKTYSKFPSSAKRKHNWTEKSRISYRETYYRNKKLRECGLTPPDNYKPAKTRNNPTGSVDLKRKYVVSGKYATKGRFEKARLKREALKNVPKRPRGRPRKCFLFESFAKEIPLTL